MAAEKPKGTEINELGEFGLINRITKKFTSQNPTTLKAVGDDAAVIDPEGKTVVLTTDMFIEGVHFDLVYTPLMHLGYKAVTGTVSDVCAMNAQPTQVFVNIAVDNRFSVEMIEEIYEGIHIACEKYGADLAGGDTTSSRGGLILSLSATGVAHKEDLVYRNSANVGDLICVSGDLGGAYMGLQVLEREKRVFLETGDEVSPELEGFDYLLQRQLRPEARLDVVKFFEEAEIKPTAMIDVSDGLASEILHITTQSGTGCELQEEHIPVAKETYDTARSFNLDPTLCALSGGEDYELLFTIKEEDRSKVEHHPDFTVIGKIIPESEGRVLLTRSGNRHKLKAQGWNAFPGEE